MTNLFNNAIKVGKGLLTTKTLVIGGVVAALGIVGYIAQQMTNEDEEDDNVVDIDAVEETIEDGLPDM